LGSRKKPKTPETPYEPRDPSTQLTVVPDSATGALEGLAGKMNIIIDAGKHSYDFEYTIPAQ